ncbi:MAG: hypothetical protein IPQ16_14080 [Geobacteraceae bacterium]|nr:hypothetical protein [Geobacteraceae bacterium]
MYSGSTLLLMLLAAAIMCTAVSAASRRQGSAWNYYHFDGRSFVAGQPAGDSPFVAVQDRAVPVVLTRPAQVGTTALPPDKGALAGISYIQSSGGRLVGSLGYIPCPAVPLTISAGTTPVMHTQTDESGYFVAVLPAGVYRVSNGSFSVETTLENGTTVLVPLRAGKRMVD